MKEACLWKQEACVSGRAWACGGMCECVLAHAIILVAVNPEIQYIGGHSGSWLLTKTIVGRCFYMLFFSFSAVNKIDTICESGSSDERLRIEANGSGGAYEDA
jgi:hypothetical protein